MAEGTPGLHSLTWLTWSLIATAGAWMLATLALKQPLCKTTEGREGDFVSMSPIPET